MRFAANLGLLWPDRPLLARIEAAARAEPDEGEIAYSAIFDTLNQIEYGGWVGCEYRPRADTDAGLSWMKRLGLR
jgi:hydroxypyruvate isomerase